MDRKLRINDIWVASKIGDIQIQQLEMQPRIEISVKDMRLQGTDGCNSIRASLKTLTETDVTFGAAMGTRKLCPNMEIPNAFNVALQSVNSYEIKENKLYLFDNNGKDSTTIIADYSISYSKTLITELKGNVVITNHTDNSILYTDQLFWDQNTDYFFSEKKFRLISPDNDIKGIGFESKKDLSKFLAKKQSSEHLLKEE